MMKANSKDILTEIHNRQLATFCLLKDFQDKRHLEKLPRRHRGLYWIWSNLTLDKMQKIPTRPDTKEVPISELVRQRCGLTNINKISHNGFTIVYNGIGGYEKTPPAFGLRERINQELNCNDRRTGTLNLLNRKFGGIENWAVSYFDFDDPANAGITKYLSYSDDAKVLEMNWRIEYGTPILTRH